MSTQRKVIVGLALGISFLFGCGFAHMYAKRHYARLGQQLGLCSDVPCDHYNGRMAAIESIIAQSAGTRSYLFVGDSHVEMADLPVICGRRPINAGIGWATLNTFEHHAHRLAVQAKPDFIVISLGTNDALRNQLAQFRPKLLALVGSLSEWPVVLVPVPPSTRVIDAAKFNEIIAALPVAQAKPLLKVVSNDGIHMAKESYVDWRQSIVDAANSAVCK